MFGNNPLRKPDKGDGLSLDVQAIFPTVQGEGPHTGMPSVFLRLGGCNLACAFCDTEFESFKKMTLQAILHHIHIEAQDITRPLVVITGGEPFRQNIAPLCEALLAAKFMVQIETNGTLWRDIPEAVDIICSPKAPRQYGPIRPDIAARVTAYKFLISADTPPYDAVPEIGQLLHTPVFLQPMDQYDSAKNAANTEHCLALAAQYGCKISFQTHKLLDMD